MEEQETVELAEPETTESEDVVEVADEGPPAEPEDLARRLFASYLETPDVEQAEPDQDSELPPSDGEEEGELESAAMPEQEAQADLDIEPSEDDVSEGGRHWYVVHSYSGYENKVKKNLEHRIESLAMQNKIFEVVVPTEDEAYIFAGEPPKEFGVFWVDHGQVGNLKKMADEKGHSHDSAEKDWLEFDENGFSFEVCHPGQNDGTRGKKRKTRSGTKISSY